MSDVLAIKHRPTKFEHVFGQRSAVNVLRRLEKEAFSQQFLLSGPSGTGKTTLARLAARLLGCNGGDIYEHDAAKHSGADDIREITDLVQHKPFGSKHKAIIIDECHALSSQAWKNLLKPIEEPPSFVTWFLCTTEVQKVPVTIKTRCTKVLLKEVGTAVLADLVTRVAQEEGIKLGKGVLGVIVKEALGSPRTALVNLATCRAARDAGEASELLHSVEESDATIELCRHIAKGGGSWVKAMAIVEKLKDKDPEGIRRIVCSYLAKVAMSAKTDEAACAVLGQIDAFSEYRPGVDAGTALIVALGKALFQGD